ncbi:MULTISPECIES: hypothetical protein [Paenibacillus]|uniref:hypothetical protein n=1 Tax=Paenibacillus TaxID=44249 RepID=UPI0022B8AAD4|nr:hypothetical protein [Paenibacillus caseinilyticus]MCZ8520416.1 hypothetical protein [Paenibacillus caseinilyticus]
MEMEVEMEPEPESEERGESMRIKVELSVGDESVRSEELVIEETKLGELTDEEIEQAIEINIRSWVDRLVRIDWEVVEEA